MKLIAVVFVLALITATCGAQTPKSTKKAALRKPAAKPATTELTAPHTTFICPGVEATQACKSYAELVAAKDEGLQDNSDDRYVCLRKNADEFFVIAISPAQFEKSWNEKFKKMMVDPSATVEGSGYAESYKDGVQDGRILPSFYFSGAWRPSFDESAYFTGTEFNYQKTIERNNPSAVVISVSQVNITYKYQNPMKQDIFYTLTIQRSTGRFVEAYQRTSEQTPFAQDTGRCVYEKGE